MFSNLSWYEVVALLLLALFIFGDKLPRMIGEGLRMLRNLRRMAQNATSDLSRELGTDIQLDDLNPRTFVRKHLLSEEDQAKLVRPWKAVSDDVVAQTRGVERELKQVSRDTEQAAGELRRGASWRGNGRSRSPATADAAAAATPAGPPAVDPAPEPLAPDRRPAYDDIT